ncbi:MAG TPA: TonB-dependent receptor [Cytophagaceae bacterium]
MKIFSCCLALLLAATISYAQQTISGKVIAAETKEPLTGAMVKTSESSTTTDINGSFILSVKEEDTLHISLLGFKRKQLIVTPDKQITIQLEEDPASMQEVIVTASREKQDRSNAPVAIHRISPGMIDEAKPSLVHEVINKIPGVAMVNLNNEQHAMSIRQPMGYNAYFLYLEDGIPIRPPGVFNHNALIEINTLSANSIEVIKGPASSLYGGEAIGGAINFITKNPGYIPSAKVGIQMDNYGYFRTQFNSSAYLTRKVGYYAGGYMARQRNGWQTFTDYDKLSLTFKLDIVANEKTKITASFTANEYDSETGGSVDSASFYKREYKSLANFTYRKVSAYRGRITANKQWNKNTESFATLFYRYNVIGQLPNYTIRRVANNPTLAHGEINENSFSSYGFITQTSYKIKLLDAKLIGGFTADYSPNNYWSYYLQIDRDPDSGIYTGFRERKDSLLVDYDAQLLNSAAYTQIEFTPIKKVKVIAGVRYDRIDFKYDNHLPPSAFSGAPDESNGFNNVTPKLGATYNAGNGKGGYINFSRGFSPPTINQLYRGVKVPEIKAAYFNNYEVGTWMYLFDKKVYADLTVYQMDGINEIITYRLPDNSTEYRNAGKTTHKGIEYSVSWSPSRHFNFRLGGTNAIHKFKEYTLKEGENYNNKEMPNAPKWIMNTEISYKPVYFPNFRISMEYQRISSYYKDYDNKFLYEDKGLFGLKGISILNLRTGYSYKDIEVFLNVMNITNELYATIVSRSNFGDNYTPAAPRLYAFGIMYHINGK